jgi:hypothetical protein
MATVVSSPEQESANPIPQSSLKMAQCYQADQQVKFLHLQAEIDVLWQELQALKQQKIIGKQSVSV